MLKSPDWTAPPFNNPPSWYPHLPPVSENSRQKFFGGGVSDLLGLVDLLAASPRRRRGFSRVDIK